MIDLIRARLQEIETSENICILYACESGSRAWGFPSADSDYDVRFLYLRPPEWYLSIDERRDVVERPIDDSLDITGWDLKKALNLLRKWNTPLLEWLGSPIVYMEQSAITGPIRDIVARHFSARACRYQYWHMAKGNYHKFFRKEGTITAKKYLYVIRPLLAVRWLEEGYGIVPTKFDILRDRLDLPDGLKRAIEELIVQKQTENERDASTRIHELDWFIEGELLRLQSAVTSTDGHLIPVNNLNHLFRSTLGMIWK